MTSLGSAVGRRVVSRATADEVGQLHHVVIDTTGPAVVALVIGSGKKALVVDWSALSGFGPDAVMITDESALRPPEGPIEVATANHHRDLLKARALGADGFLLGTVTDAEIDDETGRLLEIRVGELALPGTSLLALGSYAAVLTPPDGATAPR